MRTHETATLVRKKDQRHANGFFAPGIVQPKLSVNEPGDPFEREADAVADHVMRMSDGRDAIARPEISTINVQRKCAECEEEERVQRKDGGGRTTAEARPSVGAAVRSGGKPLDAGTRTFMENSFGRAFDHVRIHDDHVAAKSARSINALAFTTGRHIVFREGRYAPFSRDGQKLLAHELTHVVQQHGSAGTIQRQLSFDDPIGGGWLEAERRRHAELEAAETGEGRRRTLDRLAAMSHPDARRDAPGIAYRAQDRGDVELAVAAADRLLRAWLGSTDYPITYAAGFGPDDAVDALLNRGQRAFDNAHQQLGGKYLATAMVQLVRAANATVMRRTPLIGDPNVDFIIRATLPLQQMAEADVLERITRLREMIERQGRALVEQGDRAQVDAFEVIAESVFSAERQAGQSIPADLGTGGVAEEPETSGGGRRRGRAAGGAAQTGARPTAAAPPPRPPETPEAPVSRAAEEIVNSTNSELEGALVFHSVNPQNVYGNIRSPRYAIAGTLAGAHRLANELFGRRSCVIVEDIYARDPQDRSRRQVRYIVLALTVRLNPPDVPPTEAAEQVYSFGGYRMLSQPASRQYFFLTVVSGQWQLFAPNVTDYILRVRSSEAGVQAPQLDPEARREAVFTPVESLIAEGETQTAADQLSFIGSEGFALVDTETKIRYLVTLLNAFTFEAHEHTVVEIFRSLSGPAELRAVLSGLNREGVIRKLYRDMESAFPSLLIAVGQASHSTPLSTARVRALLGEMAIITPFPGIEVRGDGSVALTDVGAELWEAVEGLIATIRSAVTGIIDILADPGAFLHGLYKLAYFAVMFDLASKGNPRAIAYVTQVTSSMARQLGIALNGLAIMQENQPEGVTLVRDLQRSIQWRIVWEILGLFVGVGEAVALIDAVRSGRALSVLSDMARIGRGTRAVGAADELAEGARIAEAAGEAGRGARATEEASGVARGGARTEAEAGTAAREAGTSPHPAPVRQAEGAAPTGELNMAGGRHRVGVRNGQVSLCSGCGPLNDKLNHILDIIPDDIWYRRYFSEIRTDVRRLQRQFDAGLLTEAQFNEQAQALAGRLDRLLQATDPNLGTLLALRVDELAEVAPGMRTAARQGSDRLGTVLDEFAERQRQGRTAAREGAGTEVPRDIGTPAHIESYPGTRGPATARGEWSGTPRSSEWTPADPDVWREMGYRSVPFRDGYPDLSQFVFEYPNGRRAEVLVPRDVFFSGGRQPHFDFADQVFARQMGWLTPAGTGDVARAAAYRSTNRLTWHHVEFSTQLQLVPRRIHEAAQHAGGIATAAAL